jgi:hypothetical protein
VRHHSDVPAHPLSRREIADLADRLRGLLEMIETDEMSATTAMTYRLEGAVAALDVVLGQGASSPDGLDDPSRWDTTWQRREGAN